MEFAPCYQYVPGGLVSWFPFLFTTYSWWVLATNLYKSTGKREIFHLLYECLHSWKKVFRENKRIPRLSLWKTNIKRVLCYDHFIIFFRTAENKIEKSVSRKYEFTLYGIHQHSTYLHNPRRYLTQTRLCFGDKGLYV